MNKLLYYKPLNSHIRRYRKEVEEQLLIDEIQASKNKVLRAKEQDKINKAQAKNELEDLQLELKRSIENPAKAVKKEEGESKNFELVLAHPNTQTLKDYLSNLSEDEFNKLVNNLLKVYDVRTTQNYVNKLIKTGRDFNDASTADDVFEVLSSVDESFNLEPTKYKYEYINGYLKAKSVYKRELMAKKNLTDKEADELIKKISGPDIVKKINIKLKELVS